MAANERRHAAVDFARQRADCRRAVARQPAVDLGDHLRPIDQRVEKHQRRDQHQREEVERRRALAPERLGNARRDAGQRVLHAVEAARNGGFGFRETRAETLAGEAFE